MVLSVIGGAVAAAAWPSEEVSALGTARESGSTVLAILGSFVGWMGAMLLVGLVGYGVALGREASPPPIAE